MRIGDGDWELRFGIRIEDSDWGWRSTLGLGIRIGDWELRIRDWVLRIGD